ncbi:orotidine 5'-phosphate decarboxylase [Candidatus Endolissoclinum faulkneri L2]|uniref:Orotidine 5'-phosphate decarboxylase n=1 Tax=Candidatus Endolissoclinum faulkneri L2 TaxID=1193729 RepID=K7ZDA1_9PROT|nr:orotidine-5'-phosphate decarboxylase [Candidatus Endolissoclinum faulkneri]AFX99341.1 orotidine 5'-phosphate decarboxylase [Candidatus Endolissoclinum faulkneri L2]
MNPRERIFVAIDTTDMEEAKFLATSVRKYVGGIKLGIKFHNINGLNGVRKIADDIPLFLDLKYHDIPNTVAGAVRSAVTISRPKIINIHASGGLAMMLAAVEANLEAANKIGIIPPLMIAVTVLTSINDDDLAMIGQDYPSYIQVKRLALLAKRSGCDGVVCSPHEIDILRLNCGAGFSLIVPGIRPSDLIRDDQKRKMTPEAAIAAGADYLIIGRPITQAPNPAAAAQLISDKLIS